jgi:hypothetical protein
MVGIKPIPHDADHQRRRLRHVACRRRGPAYEWCPPNNISMRKNRPALAASPVILLRRQPI